MKTLKLILFISLFSLVSIGGMAQKITGVVVDKQSNETIPGANVLIEGQSVGTVTDLDGKFSLNLAAGQTVLKVTFIGYTAQSVTINPAQTDYQIALVPEVSMLSGIVVVGFGSQRKENLTGSIVSINADDVKGGSIQSLDKGLQGRVPGLSITYKNGGLGSTPSIQVRGSGSLNASGGGSPLILVDNVEMSDLSLVNTEDIESMTLLKDAASTSIYGTRAAFGVLLITTKGGKRNQKTTISYSNNFAWNTPTRLPDFPNDPVAELRANIAAHGRKDINPEVFGMKFTKLAEGIENWQNKYAGNRTSNNMVLGEDWELTDIKNGVGQPYFYRLWDPKKEMLKDWTAQQTHNVQISGGGESMAYSASVGYNTAEGIWKPADENLRKINASAGFNATLTKWLDVNVKYQSAFNTHEKPHEYYDYFFYMWRWGAYMPYGTYDGTGFRSPTGILSNAQTRSIETNYQRINSSLIAKIAEGLTFNVDYAFGVLNKLDRDPGGSLSLWNNWTGMDLSKGPQKLFTGEDKISYVSDKNTTQTFNAYATWSKSLNEAHNFKTTAGFNSEHGTKFSQGSTRFGLLDNDLAEINLATGNQIVQGSRSDWAVAGFFTRVNYDYKGKWLLELNGRYDGSSNFPTHSQWAFFPSTSIGYRITNEDFMAFSKPLLTDFKIRASYGTIGNQDVGANKFIPIMLSDKQVNWIEGTSRLPYADNPRAINRTLKWEKVNTLDLGFDASLLSGLFSITFDWYQRDTKDMIAPGKTLPAIFGSPSPQTNAGDLRTKGWEIAIGFNKLLPNGMKIFGSVSLTDFETTITKWNNPSMLITETYEGQKLGEIWGFETDRFFNSSDTQADFDKQKKIVSDKFVFGPGDIKYKDLDGVDGISGGKGTKTDHGDLKVIGNSTPRYQYGFTAGAEWKGFDFEFYFQGVGSRKVWGRGDMTIPYYRGGDLLLEHQMDFWTESNTEAFYPNPYTGNNAGNVVGLKRDAGGNNFYPQSKYLLNMAYLRLKNVTLGYTLPKAVGNKLNIKKMRVYLSGQNLFEFTALNVPIDPEIQLNSTTSPTATDVLGRTYPYTRTLSMGLQLTF